jgi:hypothetical protein
MKILLPLLILSLVPTFQNAFAAPDGPFTVDANTQALWDFSGSDPTMVTDLSPLANSLKSDAAPLVFTQGMAGHALKFDGKTRLVPVGATSAVDLSSGQMTVEVWIKTSPDAPADHPMGIIQYAAYSKDGFRLSLQADGKVSFNAETADKEVGLLSDDKITPGEWTDIAATFDGKYMRIFINGKVDGEKAQDGVVIQPDSSTVTLGYIGSPTRPFFIGEMNAVRILNKALTDFKQPSAPAPKADANAIPTLK